MKRGKKSKGTDAESRLLIEETKALLAAGSRPCPRCDEPVSPLDLDCEECGLKDVDSYEE